ncbi:acanthoscurrin-1-like [Teleopsis dalmanni]|uniref:acanthoscurrin-1-like n=1 Tax=Teleopsis dalmanni TaxID=139649 RepID=UPI0018CCCBA7|nr:acanthoscurrin-1-like [Teleopsis dalmanni]
MGGGGGSTIGGGSVLGGHGTLMSTAGMSNSTVGGMGVGAPPGSMLHGTSLGGVGTGNGGATPGNVYGGGGNGGGNGNGHNTAPGSVIDSRAVAVVVTLPGGPGSQHPGQALSDYGPI